MPIELKHPGVYIEEVSSGVRTITGVATSTAAFIGRAPRGPVDEPVTITSYGEYERMFGGLWKESSLGFAVRDFYANGGSTAIIVRLVGLNSKAASIKIGDLTVRARSAGKWGDGLNVKVDWQTSVADAALFNLTITDSSEGGATEIHRNVAIKPASHPRFVKTVLESESRLARAELTATPSRPAEGEVLGSAAPDGVDGDYLTADAFIGAGMKAGKKGLYSLEKVDLFNLLVIPPFLEVSPGDNSGEDTDSTVISEAAQYCADPRRAILILDAPNWSVTEAVTNVPPGTELGTTGKNAALYYPRLRQPNPLKGGAIETFPAAGAVAGVIARTDAQRGVWKAPAGLDAGLVGVPQLEQTLTDGDIGQLNPLGINCLRTVPGVGRVVWGARTMQGNDRVASEWKYLPVRRTALFIEESLFRGTQWVVFEPNDEPLWAQIRLNVGSFMTTLFRQGAFAGVTPREAFFVKCDRETTTQDDVNLGIVNIRVGFAPLKPAEFVVIRLQQTAGLATA